MEPIHFSVWDALFLFGFPIGMMVVLYEVKQFIKRRLAR